MYFYFEGTSRLFLNPFFFSWWFSSLNWESFPKGLILEGLWESHIADAETCGPAQNLLLMRTFCNTCFQRCLFTVNLSAFP